MRIHNLSLVVALTVSAFATSSASVAYAKPKVLRVGGCTVAQLRTPEAGRCLDLNISSEHHVECSGGVISCCNDEPDSHGLPAGFCIDVKRIVKTKRPNMTVAPAETAQ